MGSCISNLVKRRSDGQGQINVQDDTGIDIQSGTGIEDQRVNVEDETAIVEDLTGFSSSSSFCLHSPGRSCSFSSDSRSFLFMAEFERILLYESLGFWIYARTLDDHMVQSFHSVDIQERRHRHNYVPLPAHPLDELSHSATAVLNKNLYVIGGQIDRFVCSHVFLYDRVMYKWKVVTPTIIPRRGAVASTVGRTIYVFGGCTDQTDPWGEVYHSYTRKWTAIPHSQTLIHALRMGFHALLSSTVLGNKILIRSSGNGIAFDVPSASWCPFPPNLFYYWWNGASTAAVVQNMLITCYAEYNEDRHGLELSIRAYDPDLDVWLMLEGFDSLFHEDAHRSAFMNVNGYLVIYHMWDRDHLKFSIIEIKEKLKTSVVVNLLWRCWIPRFKRELLLASPAHWAT